MKQTVVTTDDGFALHATTSRRCGWCCRSSNSRW